MNDPTEKNEISESKIKANRKNSLKSTGPKSKKGKIIVKRNALKHGLLSKEVLIKGDNKKELEELGKRLRDELAPFGEFENILVDRIISSTWRLKRTIKIEREYIQSEFDDCKIDSWSGAEKDDSKAWNLVINRDLGGRSTWINLIRYETAIEKQIYKALHELIRLQSARKGEKPPMPIAIDVDVSNEL